jgi:hypothetical protein
MCLELWDAVSRNITSDFETEAEALAYVRVLVQQGWKAAELLLIFDDPALAVEDLPAAVSGDELARRATPSRRNAAPPESHADQQHASGLTGQGRPVGCAITAPRGSVVSSAT